MSEANTLNKQTIELVTLRGGYVWRNNTGRRGGVSFGHPGSGDVIGVYRGYFISIETKTQNDVERESQIEFLHRVNDASGFACFVRSIDEVVEFLDTIDKHEDERNGKQVIPF